MKHRIDREGGEIMSAERPYIHLSEEMTSPVETTGWDDLGLVEEWVTGYHACLAWQVTALPIYDGMAMVRGLRWDQWARRTMRDQMRFLAAWQPELNPSRGFFNPTLRSLQLRFLCGRGASRSGIWLLAKVFDPDPDRARLRARALHEEVQALFPPGYGLQPLTEASDLARCWPLATDEGEEDGWWLAEVRREVSRTVRCGAVEPAPRQPPEVSWQLLPFVWSVGGLRRTLEVIEATSGQVILGVTLRPSGLHPMEEGRLRGLLLAGKQRQAAGIPGRWRHPYLLRVCLAGRETCPDPLVRALAADLTAPDGSPRPYTVAYPEGPEEREVARRNLRWLEMEGWGTDTPLASPDRRLRYLVDVKEAQAVFRIPLLDPEATDNWGLRIE